MGQRAPVRFDGGEIDRQRAAGLGLGEVICQFGKWFRERHGFVMTGAAAAVKRRDMDEQPSHLSG